MSPDRGTYEALQRRDDDDEHEAADSSPSSDQIDSDPVSQEPSQTFLAHRSEQPQFTLRALLLGLLIGVLIAFSNTYFGLQTGWISGMAMPSALIGFAYFKGLRTLLARMPSDTFKRLGWGDGFSEVENVLVQTVAGSVGTMPLGCGFVGVVPALEFLLKADETPEGPGVTILQVAGGMTIPLGKLVLWALGLCFFGVVFAVPLRKEVIVREKLRFPSGTATALMIGVLHGGEKTGAEGNIEQTSRRDRRTYTREGQDDEESQRLIDNGSRQAPHDGADTDGDGAAERERKTQRDWQRQIRLLMFSFLASGGYTLLSYFLPQLHDIPILGTYLANTWLWTLNPSPAYVGQGIIMGPATTMHMFLGAVLGWAVLSPIAKYNGWAPGAVSDWNTGSKGWIVWVSLAIMLVDAIVSLGWLVLRPTIFYSRIYSPAIAESWREKRFARDLRALILGSDRARFSDGLHRARSKASNFDEEPEYDAPPEHQIGFKVALAGAVVSLTFCLVAVQVSFQGIISVGLTVLAIFLALFLSVMGVRALGETDLNPVSGISKLTQLIFALVTPAGSRNAVTINLVAGAISEAGALQAGDLLQDLKTGHLLGASPRAQFYGQLIGSGVGAIVSACVYKLYTHVYTIPGGLFQVPTGYVWIFTARLVTGQGLPPRIPEFAAGGAVLWAIFTIMRIYGNGVRNADGRKGAWWVSYVPGGIAVAVGMYNTPSFTLARTAGGLLAWWWTRWRQREETPMIVLASGLILGEGLFSIINLGLASGGAPHL